VSLCQACQHREPRPTTHAPMTREYYRVLIAPLRHVAYRYGYALGVHGSLGMDIDLIAVPWRDSCPNAASLVEAIRETAEKIIGYCAPRECEKDRLPEKKPCGRLAWSLYLGPEGLDVPYIDISVMPKEYTPEKPRRARKTR